MIFNLLYSTKVVSLLPLLIYRAYELENRIVKLIQLLDIGNIADRRTKGFSTGQKATVYITRPLVHNLPNVMLDEPTAVSKL